MLRTNLLRRFAGSKHRYVCCSDTKSSSRYLSSIDAPSAVMDEDFLKFQLFDVLKIEEKLLNKNRFEHVSREIISDSLLTARKIAEEKFATHNKKNDAKEPRYDPTTGRVIINPEVGEALDAYKEAGFFRCAARVPVWYSMTSSSCHMLYMLLHLMSLPCHIYLNSHGIYQ